VCLITEVEWYKERRPLYSGRHFKVTTEGDLHVLIISDTYHQDTGRYMCRAVNIVGALVDKQKEYIIMSTLYKHSFISV
jgi:hypothetical protein